MIARDTIIKAKIAFLVNSFPTEGPTELKLTSLSGAFPSSPKVDKSLVCSTSLMSRDFTI